MPEHIVIVEALTSGTGLKLVESAAKRAAEVTFVTRDIERYAKDPLRSILDSSSILVHKCETRSSAELIKVLGSLRRGQDFTLIAPNEQFLLPVAIAAEKLDIAFLSSYSVNLAQNKHEFRQACAKTAIPAPLSTAVDSVEAAIAAADTTGYPVVLKPSIGTGSYGVVSASNAEEIRNNFAGVLSEASSQGGSPLVEEFLIGPVVSAEVLYSGGQPQVLGISDRVMSELPHFLELAVRFPVNLSPETHSAITRVCVDLAELLDYKYGPAHIEFALTASGPKVVEFNPRFAGRNVPTMVTAALNWNVFDGIVASYLGDPVEAPRPSSAAAEHALYAGGSGRFDGVEGTEIAKMVPGLGEIIISKGVGDILTGPKDQRSEYGTLWFRGVTADEAGGRAASAASYLRPVISPS